MDGVECVDTIATADDFRSVVRTNNCEKVRALIESQADVNFVAHDGSTVLHEAADYDAANVVPMLIAAGANVNHRNSNGWTPLALAVFNGSKDVFRALLIAGADPAISTSDGWSPLKLSVNRSSLEMVRALLAAKADASDDTGSTSALLLATENSSVDIVQALLLAGAEVTMDVVESLHNAPSDSDDFTRMRSLIAMANPELVQSYLADNRNSNNNTEEEIEGKQSSSSSSSPPPSGSGSKPTTSHVSNGLMVFGLAGEVGEDDLRSFMESYSGGESVESVSIIRDSQHKSKGFGFVFFRSVDVASAVLDRTNNKWLMNQQLSVTHAPSASAASTAAVPPTPPKAAKPATTPSNVLGMFGLSKFTTERDIHDLMSRYGVVELVKIIRDAVGSSKGFAFVSFSVVGAATAAMKATNGMNLMGRVIRVDYSTTQVRGKIHYNRRGGRSRSPRSRSSNMYPAAPPSQTYRRHDRSRSPVHHRRDQYHHRHDDYRSNGDAVRYRERIDERQPPPPSHYPR